MPTVMCTGTFDVIHKGHLYYFSEAKKYGDNLVVVVARDSTSERVKGKKPRHDEQKRLEAFKKIDIVNKAVLGNDEDIFKIVEDINPDFICLGYDQHLSEDALKKELSKRRINSSVVRIRAYMPHKYKSSKINLPENK